jgi:galactose mutarotase-like enzyme
MERAKASLDSSFKGMRTLVLENSELKASVLLDKGSDIFELIYKPLEVDLMWHSPIGYRNPTGYIQSGIGGDAFHDFYGGGWNDIFPNYGKPSENRGTKFGQHGESALLRWECTDLKEGNSDVSAKLSVECVKYPIRAEKTISLHSTSGDLTISEDLINLAEHQVEISWAQHIAYGEPFVSNNLEVSVPALRAVTSTFPVPYSKLPPSKEFDWPKAPASDGKNLDLTIIPPRSERVQEDFPITQLNSPEYILYNPNLDLGVRVSWNSEAFPYLWYWLSWGVPDYPYFGRGRTLALEPTTSSTGNGLANDIKAGCARVLQPGSKTHGEVKLSTFRKRSTNGNSRLNWKKP